MVRREDGEGKAKMPPRSVPSVVAPGREESCCQISLRASGSGHSASFRRGQEGPYQPEQQGRASQAKGKHQTVSSPLGSTHILIGIVNRQSRLPLLTCFAGDHRTSSATSSTPGPGSTLRAMGLRPWLRQYPSGCFNYGASFTTDGTRVLSRSLCFASGSYDVQREHRGNRAEVTRLAIERPRRQLHFSTSSSSPNYFHNSRPDFLPSTSPQKGEQEINAISAYAKASTSLYKSRYLPDEDYTLPDLPSLPPDHPVSPLTASLLLGDVDKAWETFHALKVDWKQSLPAEDALAIRERLWWSVASSPAGEPSSQLERLDRLLALFSYSSFDLIVAQRRYKGVQLSLHKQRLLYLLVVSLEQAFRKLHRPGRHARGLVQLPSVPSRLYQGLEMVLDSMRSTIELVDMTILERLLYQLAVHGRPKTALRVYQDQMTASDALAGQRSHSLRGLNAKNTEALLDSLALSPKRRIEAVLSSEEQAHQIHPNEAVTLSLQLLNYAMDDGIAVGKRPLSAWMIHAPRKLLLSLLPADVVGSARALRQPWALLSAQGEKKDDEPEHDVPSLREDAKHLLCDVIAFDLAQRGDVRPALALYQLDQASGRVDAAIRSAVMQGLSANVSKLYHSSPREAKQQAAQLTEDAVNTLLDIYHEPASGPSTSKQTLNDTFAVAEALRLAIEAARRLGSLEKARAQWLHKLRRLSSSLLARDPDLDSIHPSTHSTLLKLHVAFEDYMFTKDLWIKVTRRALSDFRSVQQVQAGIPRRATPLSYGEFSWLLTESLNRGSELDLLFAVQMYLEWQTMQPEGEVQTLKPQQATLLIRRLAQGGMTHIIKRVVLDMRQQGAQVTASVARAFVEAFRYPDAMSAEQSISLVEELTRLYSSHEEALREARKAEDDDIPNQRFFIPLEVFGNILMQTTSQWLEDWDHVWYTRMLDVFDQFTRSLGQQLAYRASRPLGQPVQGVRMTEEAVRQAFNGAMRARAEWPILRLYTADQEDELACLLGSDVPLEESAINADLVVESPQRGSGAMGRSLQTTPSTRGEARRGAILDLVSTLEGDLSVAGDSETWSLKVFAWLLPGDPAGQKDRLAEALKVYEESLDAEFDYNPQAVLKPWARLPSPTGNDAAAEQRADSASEPVGSGSTSSRPVAPSAGAIMKRVRIRSRTVARLILTLAKQGEHASSAWVYHTAMVRSHEESESNLQEDKVAAAAALQGPPHPSSSTASSSAGSMLKPKPLRAASLNRARPVALSRAPRSRKVATHSLRYARVAALILQGRERESQQLWRELWFERGRIVAAGDVFQAERGRRDRRIEEGEDKREGEEVGMEDVWWWIREQVTGQGRGDARM
ncbi:hypothetical protein BCV69DRAFT_279954 [Microstroma glucosiphilum]|uniref:Uncharacterized protein n=1 Tax=Pseudomicrostroma glucosiphilum TaxID=1684307 RepID=A0A316UI95_9BASI|nr:hypothetical protein BCV69DRAFT_279954 [Pseudomicrostroma glucosiphilum]PWN24051.1 hypothetical protein BCV69DRAFT_279954 [Pseudomicrostroma glucosiphilum]